MALQTLPGQGIYIPTIPNATLTTQFGNSLLIDFTGEKAAFCGTVFLPGRGTKSIRRVCFRFGAVTKAGGSALTVSLQDLSSTVAVLQPDGTPDETVAIANADAGFTSNVWYRSGTLSADRSVTHGDYLGIVFEYDGSGRLGADSVVISGATSSSVVGRGLPASVHNTGGTWAHQQIVPNVILEMSDGTFGTLQGAWPASNIATQAFKQDTGTADEYALDFSLPFPCKVDGFWFMAALAAVTCDWDVVLYDGTSAMTGGTVSFTGDRTTGTGVRYYEAAFSQEISLTANTVYRLAIKPTQTTSNITITYFDVADANHFTATEGGLAFCLNTRLDLGAWIGGVATRRPLMGIRISSLDDGAGAGGGAGSIWGSVIR